MKSSENTLYLQKFGSHRVDDVRGVTPTALNTASQRWFTTAREIIHIDAADDYTEVFLDGGSSHLVRVSMRVSTRRCGLRACASKLSDQHPRAARRRQGPLRGDVASGGCAKEHTRQPQKARGPFAAPRAGFVSVKKRPRDRSLHQTRRSPNQRTTRVVWRRRMNHSRR